MTSGYKESYIMAIQAPDRTGFAFMSFDRYDDFRHYHLNTPVLIPKSEDSTLGSIVRGIGLSNGMHHYSDFTAVTDTPLRNDHPTVHSQSQNTHNYEVISGNQCLYWDFDGEVEEGLSELVESIKAELNASIVSERSESNHSGLGRVESNASALRSVPICINLYNSNGKKHDGSMKYSYHIVVKGVFVKDHLECGQITARIVSRCTSKKLVDAYDATVYSSKRNLRLLGSRKLNDTRVKVFDRCLYMSRDYVSPYLSDSLYMSLVSGVVEAKQLLIPQSLIVGVGQRLDQQAGQRFDQRFDQRQMSQEGRGLGETGRGGTVRGEMDHNQVTPEDIQEVASLVDDVFSGMFTPGTITKGILTMRRKKPGYCSICSRTHEKSDAFVTKYNGVFQFRCYRNPKGSPVLFTEDDDEEIELEVTQDIAQEVTQEVVLDGEEIRMIRTRRGNVPIDEYVEKLMRLHRWT